MDGENPPVRRHLLIAGTGRAGTSFLVRYLAELGLDTHVGRHAEASSWDENANAGLEDAACTDRGVDLPYVIKSPWLFEYIDELIADATFKLDAVIIPVRDLAEAAVSRSVIERRAIHESAPWMNKLESSWEEWAHVPGGIVYSLNPIDQGRLLAVGFHHLVQRLVAADVPATFLAFPRLVEDANYLFDKLRPLLPPTTDEAVARAAHGRVADRAKVRIGAEIEASQSGAQPHGKKIMGYASHAAMDSMALRRELGRLRQQLAEAHCEAARITERLHLEKAAADGESHRQRETISMLEAALARVRASSSWRMTRPYRAVGSFMRKAIRLTRHDTRLAVSRESPEAHSR